MISTLIGQVRITNTSIYRTAEQMLLANEINESGEPFAEELGYNLDDLDPMVPYSPDSISYNLGINNYEYSRYQLGTIVSRSGMGLHMIWAPVIGEMAAMEGDDFDGTMTGGTPNGYKEDDMLIKNIMHFGMLANQTPPQNAWPQFAEFTDGDPRIPQSIAPDFMMDFSTLRWDRSKMTKTLNPAAMGQTLMKQYLWAQDMLSAFHDENNEGIDPDGITTPDSANGKFDPNNNVFYGGDEADGFIGQVLTAEGINKVKFILTQLAYDGSSLGMVDPMTYDPANGIKYFPHAVSVTEEMVDATMPPKPTQFSVTDDKSQLWDQFSLIWGTLNFTNMMNPDNNESSAHTAYHSVFDGDPFPPAMSQSGMPGPYDLMKGASMVIFQNIMAMHYKMSAGSFVDEAWLDNGAVVMGNSIGTVNAGYIIVALSLVINEFNGTPLETMAEDALKMQADFIINNLKKESGAYANSYDFAGGSADDSPTDLSSQAAAIRGLYAAYDATNDEKYLTAANEAYSFLIENFYMESKHAFKSEMNNTNAVYTPFNVALISGALRSASLSGNQSEAPVIYTRFFLNVGNSMQLSEGSATGEIGLDSDGDGIPFITEQADNLPPVFASEATLDMATGISDEFGTPNIYLLSQNYPNPFNPSTTIKYQIPENGFVKLIIYNAIGQAVKTLVNKNQTAGIYTLNVNASELSSGVYIYRIQAGTFTASRKMILLK